MRKITAGKGKGQRVRESREPRVSQIQGRSESGIQDSRTRSNRNDGPRIVRAETPASQGTEGGLQIQVCSGSRVQGSRGVGV